jgi:hypothetical protein
MYKITKTVFDLSEIPEVLQQHPLLVGHKIHTFVELHINGSDFDDLEMWLTAICPTIKRKISFLIYIDK